MGEEDEGGGGEGVEEKVDEAEAEDEDGEGEVPEDFDDGVCGFKGDHCFFFGVFVVVVMFWLVVVV